MMECNICQENDPATLKLYCASCARNRLYLARLETARVLLEKEDLGQHVEAVVQGASTEADTRGQRDKDLAGLWQREWTTVQIEQAKERLAERTDQLRSLREELFKIKEDIQKRRARLTGSKAELNSTKIKFSSRQRASVDRLSDINGKGSSSFDALHSRSVDARAILCREAAALLRLQQRRRMKSGVLQEQYSIAGLLLPDLREINNVRCTDLTAAFGNTAHLLVLVAFYLGVRLPAQVTLPHRDYPLPTISLPLTSYSSRKPGFPGSGPQMSLPGSPATSRHDLRTLSRPRPLFIGSDDSDERIAQLAKKDPAAFSFFLEGISLLAWDVSWVCRSQGFIHGTESWEEACNVGRNMWHLILAPQQSPAIMRVLSSRDVRQRQKKSSGNPSPSTPNTMPPGMLGQLSHSSAHTFLGAATTPDPGRGWKLNQYTTITDSLKKWLITEMNNAEWELLEQQEWDDGGEQFDEAVFIRTRNMSGREYDDARSIMTTRTHGGEDDNPNSARARGKSGWTKVKNRDKP